VWSVLDLIWTFGDRPGDWSAMFKLDTSVVVVARDGVVLDRFLRDLTKAILNGLGWEFLHCHASFHGGRHVIHDDYLLITEAEADTSVGLGLRASQTTHAHDSDHSAPAA
jgi:hypothetical protein